ncbi:MAG TPA: hypothetical protein VFF64_25450 [Candidatus Eremiobacteraceae bacterium]|nr:hypothetical protein [Candidatus Eremiobacteraceae bacterium]
MTKKCECPKKNGEKCGAYAPTGKSVCIFHDPAREADGRRARRAGGLRRSRAVAVLPSATPDHPLGNPKEVSGLLADCINQLHRGELDTRVANAIGYVTSIHLRSLEQVSAEAKVDPTSQLYAKRLYLPDWRREVIEGLQKKELEEQKRLGTGEPKP